jgi:hypothetical protein
MFLNEVSVLFQRLSFIYVVPHAESDLSDSSMFQLFSRGICDSHRALYAISHAPRDAVELTLDSVDMIGHRMLGRGYQVIPIEIRFLEACLRTFRGCLIVVMATDESILNAAKNAINNLQEPILVVGPEHFAITRSDLRHYCLAATEQWDTKKQFGPVSAELKRILAINGGSLVPTTLPFDDVAHLVTAPNIAALASVGYTPRPWNGVSLVDRTNQKYFDAIKASVEAMCNVRKSVSAEVHGMVDHGPVDLIVTSPGVIKTWRQLSRRRDLAADRHESRMLRDLLRQIVERDTYAFLSDSKMVEFLKKPSVASEIVRAHRVDLGVYTSVLSLRASGNFVPVIRIPQSASSTVAEVSQLGYASQASSGAGPHKLNRLAQALSLKLTKGLPAWLIDQVREARRIKLIADAPLEWMSIDGLPLMLRSDVSRIPVTPGNLFVQTALRTAEVSAPIERFQKVLIIRSFRDGDPLRLLVEQAIKVYNQEGQLFPEYKIVDVSTRAELLSSLNDFDGMVMIYDGHGGHDKDSDIGFLQLASERVDPWTLRDEARVPPVVITSACNTHPFGASHATSASGFLAAGAMAVWGTSVPVDGRQSAMLVGRLLLRIGQFLPCLVRRPWRSFRWSEVLPGLQRRQFTFEALMRVRQLGGVPLSSDDVLSIMYEVGMAIEEGREWHANLIESIATRSGRPATLIRDLVGRHAMFVDAMAYVQLGNPEAIVGTCATSNKVIPDAK